MTPASPADDPIDVDDLLDRFGSAKREPSEPVHDRPHGMDDDTVEALGKLSAALETAEDARGHLYSFHRLSGRADLDLQDALESLRDAGHVEVADRIDEVLVGRDVIRGCWTFQLVEDYDAHYLEVFRAAERAARNRFGAPVHLHEAEMKASEQAASE